MNATVHAPTDRYFAPARGHRGRELPAIEPGTRVLYYGSDRDEWGRTLTAFACYCRRCAHTPDPRYILLPLGEYDPANYVLRCVRRTSITAR